ncbi:3-hydroxyacyl-CoA dehydrogenase [Rhizobium leguminosarum]|uniref:3-hydroxyacyl-CoA dehydrogenase n=1 Tax=Rhizobium leguminosarum TaxID=384 RepID=UPI001CDC95D0|nr:3-hydroxyacyl-CoA dehydrogenase [Rhizobium leguminosarum]MCA2435835.1 3-hydroxyacyl-CoA dehydrogenase [Rhizobium leguminosarum]
MSQQPFQTVAVVGAGLVGLGWAIVFARAGLEVRIFDSQLDTRRDALQRIRNSLTDMKHHGLVDDVEVITNRIRISGSLDDAVGAADYIQESVLERTDVKTTVCEQISKAMRSDAICGSSTSGIPASQFTADLSKRDRFLVVHPVNPPHLIPLVELVAAPWTDQAIIPVVREEMKRIGQSPIVINAEVDGFVLNRLQGALLNEAWALFEDGVASLADIDAAVSHGLGRRWSFMGPFETIDLNAPGGIADYARRLAPLYHSIAASRVAKPWPNDVISRAEGERREVLSRENLVDRSAWRDQRLMALTAALSEIDHGSPSDRDNP